MHARKSKSEWSAIVKAFERSGQSHAEFCAQRGLRIWSFRFWLYRVRRDRAAARTTDIALLPVSVVLPTAPPSAVVIAVADVEVRVVVGTDVGYVAGLVAELRSRC